MLAGSVFSGQLKRIGGLIVVVVGFSNIKDDGILCGVVRLLGPPKAGWMREDLSG